MIDFVELRLFVKDELIVSSQDEKYHKFLGNVLDLGIKVGARTVFIDEEGKIQTEDLYHPYDELPSSYTNLAYKFIEHGGVLKPHLMLKCSPAKILQGHNVFGSDNIKTAVTEMLGLLATTEPKLFEILNLQTISIVNLDVTYSARLANDTLVCKVLEFMRNISNGSLRKSKHIYGNTVYWGSPNSKRLARKAYCKSVEYQHQLKKLKQRAKRGETFAQRVIDVMNDKRIQDYMVGLLRLECRFKPIWLYENGISTNIWELIQQQVKEPDLLKTIWKQANKPLFDTLKGEYMKYSDDDSLLTMFKDKLKTVTAKGKISYTKANNAFNFYCLLREFGWDSVKNRHTEPTFYRNVDNLAKCGLKKSLLQNLHIEQAGQVIPFIKFVEIDFNNQSPDWWEEPVSQFSQSQLKVA